MEDGARLEDLSLLQSGSRIPAGQTWAGSPPRRVFHPAGEPDPPPAPGPFRSTALIALYVALVCILPLVELFAFVPGIAILIHFSPARMLFYLAAPVVGASFIVCLTAMVVLLKWLLIGRARAGSYAVHGWFYVRNWVVEQLLAFSVDIAGPLHATVFLKPWYRALGARLGRFRRDLYGQRDHAGPSRYRRRLHDSGRSIAGRGARRGRLVDFGADKARASLVRGQQRRDPGGHRAGRRSLVGVLTIAPSDRSRTAPRWRLLVGFAADFPAAPSTR